MEGKPPALLERHARTKHTSLSEQFHQHHEEAMNRDWKKHTYPDYNKKYDKTVKKRIWTEADQALEEALWES